MENNLCFIKQEYFDNHKYLIKMLDPDDSLKQSRRSHLCVKISINSNNYYVPLRNNLGKDIRKYGRIGHSVPNINRPNAGLDYRHTLVINDFNYIEKHIDQKIPNSQMRIINEDYIKICNELNIYISGFIKNYKKKRIEKEPFYRESSLINFINDLI